MKKTIKLFSVITLGALLNACSQQEVVQQGETVRPAKLIDIEVQSDIKTFQFPAVVQAVSSKDLTFQVPGQIETINFKEGQEVKQGEVIATLVQRSFLNDVETAQTQYDSALLEFERAERLIAENAIAQSIFDQRKSALDVATAQLDSANKALEDTQLTSPFDGIIAVKQATELQTVNSSQTIVTIQTEGAAEALIKLPASIVSRAKQIEPIESIVTLDAAPEYSIKGEFVAATTQADERSQTFDVRFGFTPPEELVILPGMTGSVTLRLIFRSDDVAQGQIAIPLHAIVTDSEGQYVWVVDEATMTVSKRVIEVGAGVADSIVIESGLQAGDVIVGAGASYLTEGMKIRRMAN